MEEDKKKGILSLIKERYNIEVLKRVRKKSTREYYSKLIELRKDESNVIDDKVKNSLRDSILKKNARGFHLGFARAAIAATFGALVVAGGVQTVQALNEGSGRTEGVAKTENSVDINTAQADREEVMEVKGLSLSEKYRVETTPEMFTINQGMTDAELTELQNNVTAEVEALESKDEILNYVKEEFVEEYNKVNEEEITVENVTLYRTTLGVIDNMVYKDFAENGEEIIRVANRSYAEENGLSQFMAATGEMVYIRVDGKTVEIAVGVSDHFERGYSTSEEVIAPDENPYSERLGNLLNAGAAYVASLEADKPLYQKKLINAMVEYRKSQMEENKDRQNENGRDSDGFEMGD